MFVDEKQQQYRVRQKKMLLKFLPTCLDGAIGFFSLLH